MEDFVKFCVENLPFKFKDAEQVALAIRQEQMPARYVMEKGKSIIVNYDDSLEIGGKVFELLPNEKKVSP